jgi:hypothetical protein
MTYDSKLSPVFSTVWPASRKRWNPDASKYVGVYAIIWQNNAYVGMTVSSNGFRGRWSRHHRVLFVLKRANKTSRSFRKFIKDNGLTASDFSLLALKAWPNPGASLTRELTDQIAIIEQEEYDRLEGLGFTMLNNIRPRGTGYEKSSGRRKRRRTRKVTRKG